MSTAREQPSPLAVTAVERSPLLTGRRVTMFTLTYPPEEVGIAPYSGRTAEHLADLGARVQVVTGFPHYPGWRVWDGYRGRWLQRERMNGVDVLRVKNYIPSHPTALHRGAYEASFLLAASPTAVIGRSDLALAVVPSLSGGALARLLSLRGKIPLGIIVQDLVGAAAAQSGVPGGRSVARCTAQIERWVLAGAQGVAVVSDAFRPYLEQLGIAGDRICQVRNWSHVPPIRRNADSVRAELGWQPTQAVVLHVGNMGFKQALENVIDAARLADSVAPGLHFVFMGDGSQRKALEALAHGLPNVSFIPPQPSESFTDIVAAADILLVNERPSVRDMSLPSKLTSYFFSSRPVLASVAPDGATAMEVERSKGGVVVPAGDAAALVATADALARNPARMASLGDAGRAYADAHLREEVALRQLEHFIARLLNVS